MPLVRKPQAPSQEPRLHAPGILEGLASTRADERWAAARAAPAAKVEVAALVTALRKETESRVREAIFTSLARIGTDESAYALLAMLRSDAANLRTGALDALRTMHDAVRRLIPTLLADRDVDVRILSCELARGLPADEATAVLCAALRNEQEPNVCAAAIEVLTEVGTSEALLVLSACSQRFRDSPFIGFAVQVATDRINASSTPSRG